MHTDGHLELRGSWKKSSKAAVTASKQFVFSRKRSILASKTVIAASYRVPRAIPNQNAQTRLREKTF
ncbi:hypothetical protein GS18_0217015 [Metabacillus indicus]|uniref:Uncharacterized protein n=1 Tax=Metabacillus indicus TaxID=246786 RepID=A0A084GP44_METID|nr:hypothetical protein GS18_0217015 [Metabacillus indicus]